MRMILALCFLWAVYDFLRVPLPPRDYSGPGRWEWPRRSDIPQDVFKTLARRRRLK